MYIKAANLAKPATSKVTKKTRLGWGKWLMYAMTGVLLYIAGFNSHNTVSRYFSALKAVPAIANHKATIVWAVEVTPIATQSAQELQHREDILPSPTANLKVR